MSGGSTTRKPRQSRPGLERLEGRMLLDAGVTTDAQVAVQQTTTPNPTPLAARRFAYDTPQGSHVVISLFGLGSLQGTSVDPDGALNLRFSGTNEQTGIVGKVTGGTGRAPIRTMTFQFPNGTTALNSISGIGTSLIRVVNLGKFDLVPGGRINLAGGVQTFFLNSAAPNSSVQLREIPAQLLTSGSSTATQNGVTLAFAIDLAGARTLSSSTGFFVPGFNLFPTVIPTQPNKSLPPPGVVAVINNVNGPHRALGIGPAQVYGYDPAADALVRIDINFDPVTQGYIGTPTVVRTGVLGTTGVEAGVTLARGNGQLLVLVSDGKTVFAFNALDAAPVGSFSVANLAAASNMPNPSRLGNVDSFVVIGDPNAGPTGAGLLQILNVPVSLASGSAVVVGPPFAATRGFGLSGGFTGVPGQSTLYAAGGAHFDTFLPDQFQLGVLSLTPSTSGGGLTESARNALTRNGNRITSNAHGGTPNSPNDALASFNENLALFSGTNGGTGTLTLYNPQTFARAGSVTLLYGGRLSGLSSVYRSALANAALVDVQGNMQSFRSHMSQGLVLNDTGNLNLVKIDKATDTTIIGNPFGHAVIPNRSTVLIVSSNRTVGDRNGVTVVPSTVQPTGPLSLP